MTASRSSGFHLFPRKETVAFLNTIMNAIISAANRNRMDSSMSGAAVCRATLENRTLKPQMIYPRLAIASGSHALFLISEYSIGYLPPSIPLNYKEWLKSCKIHFAMLNSFNKNVAFLAVSGNRSQHEGRWNAEKHPACLCHQQCRNASSAAVL